MANKILSLVVEIQDDEVLNAISSAVFGAVDASLDPAVYQINSISVAGTTEKIITVDVRPKPEPTA